MNQLVFKCEKCGYYSICDIPGVKRSFESEVGDIFYFPCRNCGKKETRQLVQFMNDEIIVEEVL